MKLHVLAAGLVALGTLGLGGAAAAQETTATPEPVSIASGPVSAVFLPDAVHLIGLTPVYQQLNRCSAAALTMQLSYYQWDGTYTDTISYLNPHAEDVAVRMEEMAAFAQTQGLQAITRTGGTLELLKALVAGGFPVLIENSYFEGGDSYNDWMGHNRVVMGYDDASAALLTFDSLLGNGPDNTGRPVPYDDIDHRWRTFNRDYLVLYRPEEESRLQAILGDMWDETANAESTLAQSQAEIGTPAEDGFTWFNIGTALLVLDRNEEAAEAFDQAFDLGLPWRMLWYQYGPLEAYLRVGRTDDVITLANQVLSTTRGVEEMFYYIALAYEAQGDLQRAEGNLEAALFRNRNFGEAAQALTRVQAALATPTPALTPASSG